MKTFLIQHLVRTRLWVDRSGQDMVEYALLAGFIAVVVGAAFPPVNEGLSEIFSKIQSTTANAAS